MNGQDAVWVAFFELAVDYSRSDVDPEIDGMKGAYANGAVLATSREEALERFTEALQYEGFLLITTDTFELASIREKRSGLTEVMQGIIADAVTYDQPVFDAFHLFPMEDAPEPETDALMEATAEGERQGHRKPSS